MQNLRSQIHFIPQVQELCLRNFSEGPTHPGEHKPIERDQPGVDLEISAAAGAAK